MQILFILNNLLHIYIIYKYKKKIIHINYFQLKYYYLVELVQQIKIKTFYELRLIYYIIFIQLSFF